MEVHCEGGQSPPQAAMPRKKNIKGTVLFMNVILLFIKKYKITAQTMKMGCQLQAVDTLPTGKEFQYALDR
jgi:hypothetical protein